MKTVILTLVVALLTITLAACTSQAGTALPTSSSVPPAEDLLDREWRLISYGPAGSETLIVEGSQVTLKFDVDSQAGGTSGCNSYGGSYQVDGSKIAFGQIASTLMACADQPVMDQEQQFLSALQSAGSFEINGDELVIFYNEGAGKLNFIRPSLR